MLMKLLLDVSADKATTIYTESPDLFAGQLLTPLSRYTVWPNLFAVDNGAFSAFNPKYFESLLQRNWAYRSRCLFVSYPDVVGSARRTLECWNHWADRLGGWPAALVAQDGQEDLPIPWNHIQAIFIGGTTAWKMSSSATDIIKAAKIIGVHVHVGRINTPGRFKHFADLGADTCDGSGIARYDWMLEELRCGEYHPLFDGDPIGGDTVHPDGDPTLAIATGNELYSGVCQESVRTNVV